MLTLLKPRSGKKNQKPPVILPIHNSSGRYVYYCPGGQSNHIINTSLNNNLPVHTLTGSPDKPTIQASVLSKGGIKREAHTIQARALRIYTKHTQKCAIDFFDYVEINSPLEYIPFRLIMVMNFKHSFIGIAKISASDILYKKASPHLNGQVERSNLTDEQEFYQLLEYTDDINIHKKLEEWEMFYNCHKIQCSAKGKTPY